jgi:hypothetical protein
MGTIIKLASEFTARVKWDCVDENILQKVVYTCGCADINQTEIVLMG